MTKSIPVFALAVLVSLACGDSRPAEDTAQGLAPVDTVKPAPATAPDTAAPDSVAAAPATKAAPTKTTGTRVRGDSIIGRDSVIMPKGKGGLPARPDTL